MHRALKKEGFFIIKKKVFNNSYALHTFHTFHGVSVLFSKNVINDINEDPVVVGRYNRDILSPNQIFYQNIGMPNFILRYFVNNLS